MIATLVSPGSLPTSQDWHAWGSWSSLILILIFIHYMSSINTKFIEIMNKDIICCCWVWDTYNNNKNQLTSAVSFFINFNTTTTHQNFLRILDADIQSYRKFIEDEEGPVSPSNNRRRPDKHQHRLQVTLDVRHQAETWRHSTRLGDYLAAFGATPSLTQAQEK